MGELKNTQGASSGDDRALAEGEAAVASSSLRDGDPSRVRALAIQVSAQCKVVAHLARALARVHDDYATLATAEVFEPIMGDVGRRSAELMETLGEVLNNMDAASSSEDEWTYPIFEAAHRAFPLRARDEQPKAEDPKGLSPQGASPIAGGEAPISPREDGDSRPRMEGESYQDRSAAWMTLAFAGDPTDGPERRDRTAEEVCEGYQADGGTLEDWIAIGRYTFGRPAGALPKEIGQIAFTLACWASYRGIDTMAEGERELARCSTPQFIEKLARKRATRHGRGPLPGLSGPETSAPEAASPNREAKSSASAIPADAGVPWPWIIDYTDYVDNGDDAFPSEQEKGDV